MSEKKADEKTQKNRLFAALFTVFGPPVHSGSEMPTTSKGILEMWIGGNLCLLSKTTQAKIAASVDEYLSGFTFINVDKPTREWRSLDFSPPALQDASGTIPAVLEVVQNKTDVAIRSYGVAFQLKENFAESAAGLAQFDKHVEEIVKIIKTTVAQNAHFAIIRAAGQHHDAALGQDPVPRQLIKMMDQFGAINKRGAKEFEYPRDDADCQVITTDDTWKLVSRKRRSDDERKEDRKRRRLGQDSLMPSMQKRSPATRLAVIGEYYFVPHGARTLNIPVMHNQEAVLTTEQLLGEGGGFKGQRNVLVVRRKIVAVTSSWIEFRSEGLGEVFNRPVTTAMRKTADDTVGFDFSYGFDAVVRKGEQVSAVRDAHILEVARGYDADNVEVYAMPAGWTPPSLILDLLDANQVPLSESDRKRVAELFPKERSPLMAWENTPDELEKGVTWVVQGPCKIDNKQVLGVGHLGSFGMVWPKTTVLM